MDNIFENLKKCGACKLFIPNERRFPPRGTSLDRRQISFQDRPGGCEGTLDTNAVVKIYNKWVSAKLAATHLMGNDKRRPDKLYPVTSDHLCFVRKPDRTGRMRFMFTRNK